MADLSAEKELEDFLHKCEQYGGPHFMPSGENYDFVFRQFSLPPYGKIDLLYATCNYHDDMRLHIVELKKNPIDSKALMQIARYRQGLLHHIGMLFPGKEDDRPKIEIVGSLIGPGLSDGMNYLIDSISWLDCYSYSLDLGSGVSFKEQCQLGDKVYWHRTDADKDGLKRFKRLLMKNYAKSERDFRRWEADWEKKNRQSNVVDFKK